MRYTRGLYHPSAFQFNLLGADMIEQPDSVAEQYRHEVKPYFV